MRFMRLVLAGLSLLAVPAQAAERPLPWGDQGDGTYRNPVLYADYSDPDVVRVGDDFYLVASDFHFVGIQVLHSRDLVNWTIVGQVFDRLPMDAKYERMEGYAEGTWAPSLRYHDGLFQLYVCTPHDGLFRWTAKDPRGPWSAMTTVAKVDGWEDPNPFWDEDGRAYLVHSVLGAGPLILHEMSADGTRLLDAGQVIYRGPVAEGPKLFKRQGWYYISLPEGGVNRGGQTILRSRSLRGPYERRGVLPPGSPHQGALVELANGETWFLGFKSTGHSGRVVHLLPVRWGEDGWPVFGDDGHAVERWKKPALAAVAIAHPQTSDEFDVPALQPQWQWNHNPVGQRWSLTERAGWLRLRGQPAAGLTLARNTLTQKLWGEAGTVTVKLDSRGLSDGQRAGLAFLSGKSFSPLGVVREGPVRRLYWEGGQGPVLAGTTVWLQGRYDGNLPTLLYSVDGRTFTEVGTPPRLVFGQWKGARVALYAYGPGGGVADFDDFDYRHSTNAASLPPPIDRQDLVSRNRPTLHAIDYQSPLTVGNGGFAFSVDVTGLQTFEQSYYQNGMPLETLSRWAWVSDDDPSGFTLADAHRDYRMADGRVLGFPTNDQGPAGQWLRRNPRNQPLGQLALEWLKPDGTPFVPADVQAIAQRLDLWSGVVASRYRLGGSPVEVTTVCDPRSDTVAVRIRSEWLASGRLRVRLAFPRGHDVAIKNTPPLDWSAPESHRSTLVGDRLVERVVGGLRYSVRSSRGLTAAGPHAFHIEPEAKAGELAFTLRFEREDGGGASVARRAGGDALSFTEVLERSADHWQRFWRAAAALDLEGSSNPLAAPLERRVVLSQYLTAVQMAGDVPPQESGLSCSTWYGKHHTEMIFWHAAHFALWNQPQLLERNLDWYRAQLPTARALAVSRGLRGARFAKMVGPDGRESPGGNPLIVWNQPHPIYLAELLYRVSPTKDTLAKYRDLVLDSAEALASMVWLDPTRGEYVLGPPLWIAQEIHDPATSQNPSFELAYWRWALAVAQVWRERLSLGRDPHWDDVIARLAPLPIRDGKYVALESHPDTWDEVASRRDHPEMLMSLGFLPERLPESRAGRGGTNVDHAIMERTLDAVLREWDFATKIWGWDYPMIAMTAARLGRPDLAVEVLLRDGPNNSYTASGHCPQRSDTAASPGRAEIAAYLPANGALLSAVALMVAGWDGASEAHPGFPQDGTWSLRAEGWNRLP